MLFFLILIVLSYAADRCGSAYTDQEEDIEEVRIK